MALTATRTTQGFEHLRDTGKDEVIYVPGDPGDTFTRGDQVVSTVGEGLMDIAAANEGGQIGNVLQTTVCPAATVAFPKPADFIPNDRVTSTHLGLVPLRPNLPAGVPVYLATFASHWDDTVVSYTAATRAIACTTGMTADDYPNGGLLYVYEGPGAGEVNIVEDYDHTGGAAELLLICHRPFATTLTSASKFIVLGGEAVASRGIGFFNRCEGDNNNLLMNQGADDGDWVVYLDWRDAARYLRDLMLPVIHARYLLLA
jgi:hypothetical protein